MLQVLPHRVYKRKDEKKEEKYKVKERNKRLTVVDKIISAGTQLPLEKLVLPTYNIKGIAHAVLMKMLVDVFARRLIFGG